MTREHTEPETMTLMVLTHRGETYVRVDDVAAYLRAAGAGADDGQAFEHVAACLVDDVHRMTKKSK
jgi:hypothetical protein